MDKKAENLAVMITTTGKEEKIEVGMVEEIQTATLPHQYIINVTKYATLLTTAQPNLPLMLKKADTTTLLQLI